MALKEFALEHDSDLNIQIIDGTVVPQRQIIQMIHDNIYHTVGIQPKQHTQDNTLELLDIAKNLGARVFFGRAHASHFSEEFLKNRNQLDGVIVGDGEKAFLKILQECNYNEIPNLVFRNNRHEIIRNSNKSVSRRLWKPFSFDERDMLQYGKSNQFKDKYVRIYSHRGYINRSYEDYCSFCGRYDAIKGMHYKEPDSYVSELQFLVGHGVKMIFDIGDNYPQNPKWLQQVAEKVGNLMLDTNTNLKIYSRAKSINQHIIKLLQQLNVYEVAMGVESGDERLLNSIHKRTTPEENMEAIELLIKNNIRVVASYIVGLPGENKHTMEKTSEFIYKMKDLHENQFHEKLMILADILDITPGSQIFRKISNHFTRFAGCDTFSSSELFDAYLQLEFELADRKAREEKKVEFQFFLDRLEEAI